MSVETLAPQNTENNTEVLLDDAAHVEATLEGIKAATNAREAKDQQLNYAEIAEVFRESHEERVDAITQRKRERILKNLLDDPIEGFRGEFLQLQLLYENRSTLLPQYDGSEVVEFCTQNHEKATCDYVFKYKKYPDGRESYQVSRVFMTFGEPTTVVMRLEDDQFSCQAQIHERGRTHDIDIEGDQRERVMAELFYDTISASALQIERDADARKENDARAKLYLKRVRDSQYMLT